MIGAPASLTPSQNHSVGAPAPTRKWRWLRIIPLAAAVGSLITGLWAGLARLGVAVPSGTHTLAEFHGALMISGFLGTLISLERAVAIGRWWAYTAPALSATGAVALIVGMPTLASYSFLFAGLALVFASSVVVARQPALFTFSLAASRSSRSASATRRALPVCEAEISVIAGISTAVAGTAATAPGCWLSIPQK